MSLFPKKVKYPFKSLIMELWLVLIVCVWISTTTFFSKISYFILNYCIKAKTKCILIKEVLVVC